jgi:hypothetical protein
VRKLPTADVASEIHNLGFIVNKMVSKSVKERYLAHSTTTLNTVMANSVGIHFGPIDF